MDAMTILTGILVLVTAIYAYLTYRMVKATEVTTELMKRQSDSMSRPYVTLSLVKPSNNPFILLRIENTGLSVARDMTLTLGPEYDEIKDIKGPKELKDAYLFKNTITSFPPHSPVVYVLGFGASYMADDETRPQKQFSITARYSFSDQIVNETTWLDVNQYDSTTLDTDPVVSALQKIKDEIAKKK